MGSGVDKAVLDFEVESFGIVPFVVDESCVFFVVPDDGAFM